MALRTYSRNFCPFRVRSDRKTQDDSAIPHKPTSIVAAEMESKPKRSKSLGTSQSATWICKPKGEDVPASRIFSKTYTAKKRKLSSDSLAMLVPAFVPEKTTSTATIRRLPDVTGVAAHENAEEMLIKGTDDQKKQRKMFDVGKLHDKLQYFARIDLEQLSVSTEADVEVANERQVVRTQRADIEVTNTKLWQVYQEYAAGTCSPMCGYMASNNRGYVLDWTAIADVASPISFHQFKKHQHKFIDELYDGIFDVR